MYSVEEKGQFMTLKKYNSTNIAGNYDAQSDKSRAYLIVAKLVAAPALCFSLIQDLCGKTRKTELCNKV